MTALVLESVPCEDPLADGEHLKVRGHVGGAGVGAVEQRDEPERGGPVQAELAEEIVLDHTRGDHVLEHVDVAAADVGVAEEVDLQRVGGGVVGHVADDVDEAVADVAGNGPQQIGQEAGGAFEDAEEEDLGVAGIVANGGTDLTDPRPDLFRRKDGGEDGSDVLHPSPPSTLRRAFPPGAWSP